MHPTTFEIINRLDKIDRIRLSNSAEVANSLEYKWKNKIAKELNEACEFIIQQLDATGELQTGKIDFLDFFLAHSFDVQREAMELAQSDLEKHVDPTTKFRRGSVKIPRRLPDLFKLWDFWRRRELVPKRQKQNADAVKKEFLKRVRSAFEKHSEGFRQGDAWSLEEARRDIREAGKTTYSRAQNIVNTETTNYYNHARREVYDASPDVVAYLFLAIRDQATTKWCSTRNGLVYHRGDPHLNKETPAIHWNCRSEMLPLVLQNPRHLVLISDPALDRRNHRCEPLPRGWTSSRVA